jgi:hypothetical protein
MSVIVALVFLGLAVLLNFVATIMLSRSDFETPIQKVLQYSFIWIIPFVGSIIVIAVMKSAHSHDKSRFDSGSAGSIWLPGIGTDSGSMGVHHSGHGEVGSSDVGHGGDVEFDGH